MISIFLLGVNANNMSHRARILCYGVLIGTLNSCAQAESGKASELQQDLKFKNFKTVVWSGPTVAPKMSVDQKVFRSRINAATQSKVSFAGSAVIMQTGCGTSCTIAYVIDKRTGAVTDVPFGGEENPYMELAYRPWSKLMWVSWREGEGCKSAALEYQDGSLKLLRQLKLESCDN